MAWCKQRALEYVEQGESLNAIASILSDLGKHPDTAASVNIATILIAPYDGTAGQVTKWIDGFN